MPCATAQICSVDNKENAVSARSIYVTLSNSFLLNFYITNFRKSLLLFHINVIYPNFPRRKKKHVLLS